jgi:hypothetical protein
MAHALTKRPHATIDRYLAYLVAEWKDVPKVAAEWADWDEHDRLDFVVEWPIREDRLLELRRWAARGLLSAEQHAGYRELEETVRRHRPDLERLLAD